MPPHAPSLSTQSKVLFWDETLDNLIPALVVAKAVVTGLGVPGLEAAVSGFLKVLQMVQVCSNNHHIPRRLNVF